MNVSLSAKELLHVLETVVRNPMSNPLDQEELLESLKKPIHSVLVKEDEKLLTKKFESWTASESKKIEELSQKNSDLTAVRPPKVAAMKGKKMNRG